MGQVVSAVVSVIAGVILGTLSNWIYDLFKGAGIFPEKPTLKKVTAVGLGFVPFILLVILPLLLNGPNEPSPPSPPPTPTNIPNFQNLKVRQISGSNKIEVSWKDFPQVENLYLMTSDGHRYYSPKQIHFTSGIQEFPLNSGITSVIVAEIPEGIGNFTPNGVEIDDTKIRINVKKQQFIE